LIQFGCKKEKADKQFVQEDGGRYSEIFTGGEFHLGPVDWQESEWTNAFGPYPAKIQQIEGNYLAGLELSHNGGGEICDACIKIETEMGKSLILRVITTGYTTPNSIDVSPEAYAILNSGEYPRNMSWYITKCPDNGENVYYQFKTGSNPWWVAFWTRNVALPISTVEVISDNHAEWYQLRRETDGSYVDNSGFASGEFTIRLTAIDGSVIEDTYRTYQPGGLLESSSQF
jgi:expansin (peptidoglycan-binding protein)